MKADTMIVDIQFALKIVVVIHIKGYVHCAMMVFLTQKNHA
jgi:hypothetical protein